MPLIAGSDRRSAADQGRDSIRTAPASAASLARGEGRHGSPQERERDGERQHDREVDPEPPLLLGGERGGVAAGVAQRLADLPAEPARAAGLGDGAPQRRALHLEELPLERRLRLVDERRDAPELGAQIARAPLDLEQAVPLRAQPGLLEPERLRGLRDAPEHRRGRLLARRGGGGELPRREPVLDVARRGREQIRALLERGLGAREERVVVRHGLAQALDLPRGRVPEALRVELRPEPLDRRRGRVEAALHLVDGGIVLRGGLGGPQRRLELVGRAEHVLDGHRRLRRRGRSGRGVGGRPPLRRRRAPRSGQRRGGGDRGGQESRGAHGDAPRCVRHASLGDDVRSSRPFYGAGPATAMGRSTDAGAPPALPRAEAGGRCRRGVSSVAGAARAAPAPRRPRYFLAAGSFFAGSFLAAFSSLIATASA
jgi:hypothetical protein